ncbi:U4 U6.U5 tri-snRNP-associated protein [Dispira parvispora]|uniref:U4 U6.U5 tri-snRNP-associated protein n=1 Tax=Dispira parvispora TaxID=1520584 RepID=A0A9W8ARJ9_9FUNG|nr:U4 U6.U5 tri-snRNP-associated protein [Dispira parvispora]
MAPKQSSTHDSEADTGHSPEHQPLKRRKTDLPVTSSPLASASSTQAAAQISKTNMVNSTPSSSESTTPIYRDLYLETVDRSRLDFDFEKVCSVSLSDQNVYACLVCGKYYQGRGRNTHAYFHSVHQDHHVFIHLTTLQVYVLPEGYQVTHASLNDIKQVIRPVFNPQKVRQLDTADTPSVDLANHKYLPGFVGLNNIKANDYINVVVHALAHVTPLRNYCLLNENVSATGSPLVQQFALLLRKLWNDRAFKSQVSPHEFIQEVVKASRGKFNVDTQGDALEFLSWCLNALHKDMGGNRKPTSSIIYSTFQGTVEVATEPVTQPGEPLPFTDNDTDPHSKVRITRSPFLFLTLDLPPAPLFQDDVEQNIIPQISLEELLTKFNGHHSITVPAREHHTKRYHVQSLPPYLILAFKRFARSQFSVEKNPTLVTFPITHLAVPKITNVPGDTLGDYYNLVANISHQGNPEASKGHYNVDVRHPPTGHWYQFQDLLVEKVDPQRLLLTESYIQIWERCPAS